MSHNFVKFFIAVTLFFSGASVFAQEAPLARITWKASNYHPPFYEGKNLPGHNTPTDFYLTLIDNGKTVDLSPYHIRWYQDSNIVIQGTDLRRMTTNAQRNRGNETIIKAAILNYKNIPEIWGIARVSVPRPKAIIDAPYAEAIIKKPDATLTLLPYFFNVTNLSELRFDWLINNNNALQPSRENPQLLKIIVPETTALNTTIAINARISSPANLESAQNQVEFKIQ